MELKQCPFCNHEIDSDTWNKKYKNYTKEQKDLINSVDNALYSLKVFKELTIKQHGDNEFTKMIDGAINVFTKLYKQWAISIGHPQEISKETLYNIIKMMQAMISEGDDSEFKFKHDK